MGVAFHLWPSSWHACAGGRRNHWHIFRGGSSGASTVAQRQRQGGRGWGTKEGAINALSAWSKSRAGSKSHARRSCQCTTPSPVMPFTPQLSPRAERKCRRAASSETTMYAPSGHAKLSIGHVQHTTRSLQRMPHTPCTRPAAMRSWRSVTSRLPNIDRAARDVHL